LRRSSSSSSFGLSRDRFASPSSIDVGAALDDAFAVTDEAERDPRFGAGAGAIGRRLAEIARSGVPVWLLGLAVLLPLLLFFVDLGTPSLWDPDEGLPAEVAREMLVTRRWLVPQL